MLHRIGMAGAVQLFWGGPVFGCTADNSSGTFSADDNMVLFTYSVQDLSQVTFSRPRPAGFPASLPSSIPRACLQTTLKGISRDTSLSWVSNPGEEHLGVLTEYDNVSFGPLSHFSDGFTEQRPGNFTARPLLMRHSPELSTRPGECSEPETGRSRSARPT